MNSILHRRAEAVIKKYILAESGWLLTGPAMQAQVVVWFGAGLTSCEGQFQTLYRLMHVFNLSRAGSILS